MKTLLYNGNIYQDRDMFAQSILIEDNRIITVGSDDDLFALREEANLCVDLQGRTVVPGFNDSHQHFLMSAIAFTTVDLYGSDSIQTVIQRGKDFLSTHPSPSVLFGRGWNQDYFTDESRLLNRQDLDKISSDFPIVFSRACGHVVVCNSKALEVCQVSSNTLQIDGGHFDVDPAGEPTGVFRENAMVLLGSLQSQPSTQDYTTLLDQVGAIANSYGITSVQSNDINVGKEGYEAMEEAYRIYSSATPTVRVYHQTSFIDVEAFEERIRDGYHRSENDFNRYGPLKLFVDGSLGARTALVRSPYADDPSTQGIECLTPETLNEWVRVADRNGIQVAIHAIGDQAMANVLDVYEEVIHGSNELRHGIIHCQITDIPLLERFAKLDVLAYVQPIFLHYDLHIVEDRVGKPLASTSYAFQTMEKLGIRTAYGTDSPVEGFNVFHCIHCAVNRQDLSLFPEGGFYPQERVDLATAIDRYTLGGAYASFDEHQKGRLYPGYLADLVVLDRSIFDLDPTLIKEVKVEMTMVDGRIVYQR
ncbi:MAG TPA: amidohydrolase [Erysipelotrichaceae bacterium]|nr:MAG: hypothetical protein A3K15_00275 [Candidatus Edwardsbacteria bacterium GWE2_54_12]HBZ40979.1 amidohydrolase [Erysipelotrichaceae bacterium]